MKAKKRTSTPSDGPFQCLEQQERATLFEAILDAIPELIVYYDDNLDVLWANQAAATESSTTPEEMVGHNFFKVACRMKEPCEGCPVVKGVSSESAEIIENNLFVGKLFFSRTYPVHCLGTRNPGRVFVGQDISLLRNRYSVNEILNLISEVFSSPKDLSEICDELIKAIAERFDYPAAYITLYDEQRHEIVNTGQVDISGRFLPLSERYPPSTCFSWDAIRDGKTINVTGLSKVEEFGGYVLKEAGVETVLAAPLIVERDTIGAIVLIDFMERLETNLMIDGLQAVANRLGAEIRRKQAEEKLREERNFTNAVLKNAGPLIIVLDGEGRVARFNKTCERLTGYSYEDVQGKFFWDLLLTSKEQDTVKEMFPLTGKEALPTSFEGPLVTRDGQKRLISWSNSVMEDVEEAAVHVVSIGIDITDRRKAEEEAELRMRQLVEADKMASLGILASGVAHEINNPNNFIMMNAPILRTVWEDVLPILDRYHDQCGDFTVANMPYSEMRAEVPTLFEGVEDGSERIRKIVMNMKDYAKKDASDMTQKVSMEDVIAVAVELLAHEIKKSTQSLVIECPKDLPPVRGNRQRLEQVMVNLIQNSCQALPKRTRGIVVRAFHLEDKDEITVCVADEGVGIKPEHLGHIFDPFFTTKSDRGGTGLGLSVCAGIVKEHHGRLEFESESGKGTRAYLSLPAMH